MKFLITDGKDLYVEGIHLENMSISEYTLHVKYPSSIISENSVGN